MSVEDDDEPSTVWTVIMSAVMVGCLLWFVFIMAVLFGVIGEKK